MRCTGITKRGNPCKNNAVKGEEVCYHHNGTVCPICFEQLTGISVIKCQNGHAICMKCELSSAINHNMTCPICRAVRPVKLLFKKYSHSSSTWGDLLKALVSYSQSQLYNDNDRSRIIFLIFSIIESNWIKIKKSDKLLVVIKSKLRECNSHNRFRYIYNRYSNLLDI